MPAKLRKITFPIDRVRPRRDPQIDCGPDEVKRCVICSGQGMLWQRLPLEHRRRDVLSQRALVCDTCDGFGYLRK
jgi:hypothetical protein